MKLTTSELRLIRNRINAHRVQDKRKGRNPSNNLTVKDWLAMWEYQQGKCWWTGMPMTIEEASVDRLDCNKPHTADNCVLTLASINFKRKDTNVLTYAQYLYELGLLEPTAAAILEKYFNSELMQHTIVAFSRRSNQMEGP